jgi:hypothetical protein
MLLITKCSVGEVFGKTFTWNKSNRNISFCAEKNLERTKPHVGHCKIKLSMSLVMNREKICLESSEFWSGCVCSMYGCLKTFRNSNN